MRLPAAKTKQAKTQPSANIICSYPPNALHNPNPSPTLSKPF